MWWAKIRKRRVPVLPTNVAKVRKEEWVSFGGNFDDICEHSLVFPL